MIAQISIFLLFCFHCFSKPLGVGELPKQFQKVSYSLNFDEISPKNLKKVIIDFRESVWSGDYHAFFHKGLFKTREVKNGFNLERLYNKEIKENSLEKILSQSEYQNLSIPHKVDLLFQSQDLSFSQAAYSDLDREYQKHKKMRSWTGYCDGFSTGSILLPKPNSCIKLSLNGKELKLTPADLMGMAAFSLQDSYEDPLGQKTPTYYSFGSRCGAKYKKNSEETICETLNPGSFYSVLMNRSYKDKKSFVADLGTNEEVWNYPLEFAEVTYFKPGEKGSLKKLFKPSLKRKFANFSSAKLTEKLLKKYYSKKDRVKFESHFSKVDSIVGVKVKLKFANYNRYNRKENYSSPKNLRVHYKFLLELDSRGEIIGGKWLSNEKIPDFLWQVDKRGMYDLELGDVSMNQVLDLNFSDKELDLIDKSLKHHHVPFQILEKLFEMAHSGMYCE